MINRIPPRLSPAAMITFATAAPLGPTRHWRKASCREVDCKHWREGWISAFDESDPDQHAKAQYVRNFSGRRFTETRDEQGRTIFRFHTEQMCFHADSHVIRDEDVPPLYVARGGDWRQDTSARVTVHSGPDPWLDHMQTNLERVAARLEPGE
ncbi:hypothetical protein [Actinosynnema sp. NPDC023587]|uniref:hypothetical protein n=1 Tax=Actinosynnema sp. NPDC023587 TaxID=3154695 RepID=UPI003407FE73